MHQIRNPNLKMLALRLLARHYPEVLNAEEQALFAAYRARTAIFDFKGELKRTHAIALHELKMLPTERVLDAEQNALLTDWGPKVWDASTNTPLPSPIL